MQNLYNIVAELCASIVNSCSEEFFVRYSCVSPAEKRRIYKEVQASVGTLFLAKPEGNLETPDDESIRELVPADLTDSFYANLQALIGRFTENGDYCAMLGLLQILDQSMALLLNEAIGEFEQESFSIVLNTNRESVGVGILPRCSCIWERKHRLVHRYNNLESFLYNILLIENSVLGELIDEHYFLKKDLFPRFRECNGLKIAATPLRRERNFKVNTIFAVRLTFAPMKTATWCGLIPARRLSRGKRLISRISTMCASAFRATRTKRRCSTRWPFARERSRENARMTAYITRPFKGCDHGIRID